MASTETAPVKELLQNGSGSAANGAGRPVEAPQTNGAVKPSGPPAANAQYHPLPPQPKPLQVLIIGAGIAGLTAAAALRQMGHEVKLFEQSRFSNEVGAAIHVGPNASRLLKKIGYSEERLRGVNCLGFSMQTSTGKVLTNIDNRMVVKMYKSPHYLAHRVDLHNELKHLALDSDMPGKPAELTLSAQVTDVDAQIGTITLANGETHQGDLVIAADGVHSRVRELVFDPAKPKSTGTAAYRFTVDAEKIVNDPECLPVVHGDGVCRIIIGQEKRVVLYPCRDSTLLNFVCMYPAVENSETASGWNTAATVDDMLETYKDFDPRVLNMLKKAEKISCWQLLERNPIPSWVKGRVALIGDAAHPMLPHHGQGGGQAMEDGAALGQLFTPATTSSQVPDVLKLFQQVRYERASKVQWMSATTIPGKSTVPPPVLHKFLYEHDVTEYANHTRSSVLLL